MKCGKIKTAFGSVEVFYDGRTIVKVHLKNRPAGTDKFFLAKHFLNYFNGRLKVFNIQYRLNGSDFQNKVWRAIARIPYGQTLSYKELARKIGRPESVRAVANACGANQLLLIIPCHRVIKADGCLGGVPQDLRLRNTF